MAQLLQEYVDSRGVALSVDRDQGILRGVKLIGLESRNGRRYREAALAEAAILYEDAKVNVNHPKEGPLSPRDYQDRLGVIRGVELRAGEGLFGDLHFNPKHALAEQLLWDAQHNPHNVGFSHNVLARLTREHDLNVVEEITKVQSVDLVADPATTSGLFEQAEKGTSEVVDAQAWHALSKEVLELHRPDLVDELRSAESQRLQQQLDEAESRLARTERKQRIFELLCEHQLSVATESSVEPTDPHRVSSTFVEAMISVSEDNAVEALIAERAELARVARAERDAGARMSPPFSRDQTLLSSLRPEKLASAEQFASALKSSFN